MNSRADFTASSILHPQKPKTQLPMYSHCPPISAPEGSVVGGANEGVGGEILDLLDGLLEKFGRGS